MATSPSIFSRLVLLAGGLAVLGLAYWFIRTSLMPVTAPTVALTQGTVRFDPSLDVSKNDVFYRLHTLIPAPLPSATPGRVNPFVPVPPAPVVSATPTAYSLPPTASSTPSATSSLSQAPATTSPAELNP